MRSKRIHHLHEMPCVLFLILREDQNIIYEDHDKLVQELPEHPTHPVHEICGCISQAERHDKPFEESIWSSERSLVYTIFSYPELMKSSSKIKLRENKSTDKLVKEIINPW